MKVQVNTKFVFNVVGPTDREGLKKSIIEQIYSDLNAYIQNDDGITQLCELKVNKVRLIGEPSDLA